MNPGRELDALVAEKVMGWEWPDDRCEWCGWGFGPKSCDPDDCSQRPLPKFKMSTDYPRYSTDIAAAWMVVEKFDAGYNVELSNYSEGWRFAIYKDGTAYAVDAPTAAHAICLAALQAVGVELETQP